jgi:hypothetical protein
MLEMYETSLKLVESEKLPLERFTRENLLSVGLIQTRKIGHRFGVCGSDHIRQEY